MEKISFQDVNFTKTRFPYSNLSRTDLSRMDLSNCKFRRSDLSHSKLHFSQLSDSMLEYANLTGTDLRGTDLKGAFLYQTLLTNAKINDWTEFDDECIYNSRNIEPADSPADKFSATTWVYRSLAALYKDNAMAEQARHFHIKKEESQRAGYQQEWQENKDIK